ncbi:MAG: zf-HC2 domain-containing protein [Actinobacteria bacterium]|nr:zf-HC2 domain-containing protein [Actinomycetota bacterium]
MTCPITVRLGVYALGAADAAERDLVESHLAICQACRNELARLQPLPELLERVPMHLRGAHPPASPRRRMMRGAAGLRRGSADRWRAAVGLAAAVALGFGSGFWLAHPAASSPPAAITLSGTNPVTHVRATATLTGTSWGTSIRLRASGLPLNQTCQLIVRSRTGATEITGAWDAWRSGSISVPASAAWRPADIASLQVATTSQSLVTITAARQR